jgi:hypothetical protein
MVSNSLEWDYHYYPFSPFFNKLIFGFFFVQSGQNRFTILLESYTMMQSSHVPRFECVWLILPFDLRFCICFFVLLHRKYQLSINLSSEFGSFSLINQMSRVLSIWFWTGISDLGNVNAKNLLLIFDSIWQTTPKEKTHVSKINANHRITGKESFQGFLLIYLRRDWGQLGWKGRPLRASNDNSIFLPKLKQTSTSSTYIPIIKP